MPERPAVGEPAAQHRAVEGEKRGDRDTRTYRSHRKTDRRREGVPTEERADVARAGERFYVGPEPAGGSTGERGRDVRVLAGHDDEDRAMGNVRGGTLGPDG